MPAASRIYRNGVQQISDSAVLHRIEIFSQGDLQTIAERPDRRLALIDRPNQRRVAELAAKVSEVTDELKELGRETRKTKADIESRQAKVLALQVTKKQLAELQSSRPKLSPELEAERVAVNQRRRAFEQLKEAGKSYGRTVNAARTMLIEESSLRDAATFARGLGTSATEQMVTALAALLDVFPAVRGMIDKPVDKR